MVSKLGMLFDEENIPDFGSIEKSGPREYTLLSADIDKLNHTLTRSVCGSVFNVPSGANAVVVDKPEVWKYHSGSDKWYEVISDV